MTWPISSVHAHQSPTRMGRTANILSWTAVRPTARVNGSRAGGGSSRSFECVGGMYAALNAGIERASGTWVGFLNCDEQYLPGALRAVIEFAAAHPRAGMITGDFLVVRPEGGLICHRREIVPRPLYIRSSYLYTFTCALFIRREVLTPDLRFDPRFRASGDEEFVLRSSSWSAYNISGVTSRPLWIVPMR